ncbi:MAG: hypothetical protein ACUVXI_08885 [bacterium]
MRHPLAIASSILVALLCGGCFATFRTAQSLGTNRGEGGVSFVSTTEAKAPDFVLPRIWVRRGFTDNLDLGVGTYGAGLMGDFLWQILPDGTFTPALALDGGLGIYFVGVNIEGAVIVSKSLGPITPYGGYKGIYINGATQPGTFGYFPYAHGPFGGVAFKIGESVQIMGECTYIINWERALAEPRWVAKPNPDQTYIGGERGKDGGIDARRWPGAIFGIGISTQGNL